VLLLTTLNFCIHSSPVHTSRLRALRHSPPVHTLQVLLLKTSNFAIHSPPIHTLQVMLLFVRVKDALHAEVIRI